MSPQPTLLESIKHPARWMQLTRAMQAAIDQAAQVVQQVRLACGAHHPVSEVYAGALDVLCADALAGLGGGGLGDGSLISST